MTKKLEIAAMLCLSAPVSAQTVEQIYSTKDAVIGYHYGINSADNNYNSADWYGAMSQDGNHGGPNHARSLIHFDLSAYPPGTPIDVATLDLFGRGPVAGTGAAATVGNTGNNVCVIERVTSAWLDYTVTWNTTPSSTAVNAVTLPVSNQTIEDYEGIDVTALVQDMINNPGTSHGFLIRLVVEQPTRSLFFCGNGFADPAKRPRLNVKVNTIGVAEVEARPNLRLFPNPAPRGGRVSVERDAMNSVASIDLHDGVGRLVATIPLIGDWFTLPGDMETGAYVPLLRSAIAPVLRLDPLVVAN